MISILVLNYNGKHHLDECVTSIQAQSFQDFELVLVDNNSTDGSQEYIKSKYPSVKSLSLDKNYGFCTGNNQGIKAAKGDYIILLNNDTVVHHDWLQNLHDAITSDPSIGFCASKMISYYNKDLIDSAGDGFSICGAGFKRGHMAQVSTFNQDEYVYGACGGAVMYKKEMLDKIGLLDDDYFAIYEDADLSFRAQLAGYRCKYVHNAIVYHKINSTLGKLSDFYVYYGHRNVEYTYFKNVPSKLIPRTILHHLLYDFLAFIYFLKKGKGLVFTKAKLAFLKDFRKVLEKRKKIQSLKVVDDDYIWSIMEKKWLSTRMKGK